LIHLATGYSVKDGDQVTKKSKSIILRNQVGGRYLSLFCPSSCTVLCCAHPSLFWVCRSYFFVCDDLESKANWMAWLTQATSPLATQSTSSSPLQLQRHQQRPPRRNRQSPLLLNLLQLEGLLPLKSALSLWLNPPKHFLLPQR